MIFLNLSSGTSAMSNHVKSKHPEKFVLLNKGKAKDVPTLLVEPAIPGPSTSLSSTRTEKQLTVSESFERKLLLDLNEPKAKKYHYLIAEMIALDNEPLSMVERVGFKRLLQQTLPRYELPSRTYMTNKIVPDIYNRIVKKIKTGISSAVAVSVTSDIWTCVHNNSSF